MDLNVILLVVAGVVAPFLNSLLKQPAWSSRRKWVVSLLSTAGLTGLAQAVSGDLSPDQFVQAGTAVFVGAQALYHLIKHTKVNKKLEAALVREDNGDGA